MTVSVPRVPLPPSYQIPQTLPSPVSLPSFPTNRTVLHPLRFTSLPSAAIPQSQSSMLCILWGGTPSPTVKKKKKNLFEERKILGISGFLFLFSEQDFAFRDPKFWSGIQKFLSSENRCHEVVLIRFLRCKLTHIVILFSISVSCQPVFQLIWKLESREEHAAGPNSYSFRKDSRLTHAQLRPTPHR